MKYILSILLLLTISTNTFAQEQKGDPTKSINGIVAELLDQVTIEPGEKMDTAAVRNLFYPSALLTVNNGGQAESVSLDDFLVLLKDPYYEAGYLEQEIQKTVDEFNGIAQVFQTFYGKDSEGEEEKGINSYQLTYHEGRWWIVSLLWSVESDTAKIPAKYGGE